MYENSAGLGGAICNTGNLTVAGSTILNNQSTGSGGGIYNSGTATLQGATTVNQNTAGNSGGGIFNDLQSTLTVKENSEIAFNTAKFGGGILNYGTFTMNTGDISSNSATGQGGGGIYTAGPASLQGVAIQKNSATKGGGVYIYAGNVTFTGCTISNNTATILGAGIAWKAGSTYTLINCIVTDAIQQDA